MNLSTSQSCWRIALRAFALAVGITLAISYMITGPADSAGSAPETGPALSVAGR